MLNQNTKIFSFLLLLFSLAACQSSGEMRQEKSVKEIKSAGKIDNASIIRNPVSANALQDTVNVAKFHFNEPTHNFGTVEEGTKVTHSYEFTNVGKVPLVISNARSTCGCTVPEWSKEPIEPGKKGVIKVEFNTKGKKKNQRKPVYITANTYPAETKIYLEGLVTSESTDAVAQSNN